MQRSNCHLLLNLHNLHRNAVTHGDDPFALLDRAPLDRVVEIHVGGGSWHNGFWMDGHNGPVPSQVWDLLAYTLSRAPQVGSVVFEVLDEFVRRLGVDAITVTFICLQIVIWQRCQISRLFHEDAQGAQVIDLSILPR